MGDPDDTYANDWQDYTPEMASALLDDTQELVAVEGDPDEEAVGQYNWETRRTNAVGEA